MDAKLANKPRIFARNRYLLLTDLALILLSVLISWMLRLDLSNFYPYRWAILTMVGVALLVKPIVFYFFGLYRRLWIYASVNELKVIVTAVSLASLIVATIMLTLFSFHVFTGFSRMIPAIDWFVSLAFVGGSRFLLRIMAEPNRVQGRTSKSRNVLVIGAGDAGALVVREMKKYPQLNLIPIGFLDDDPGKQKHQIHGVPVVGKLEDLAQVLDSRPVDEVIIAIPSAGGRIVRMVTDLCRLKRVSFRTMPGLYELIGGKVSVNRLREVDIADLLRREPAQIQNELVGAALSGKRVLVTGAGGSIGRELCRQIARWNPSELTLLGHGENSIFEAMLELQEAAPSLSLQPVIADIRDQSRLQAVLKARKPQVIFHAAAHKHVPLMESNVEEAVTNNVIGTRNVVETSIEADVERLVMISTDKAIRPANVMGATKRLAEMIVLEAAHRTGRAYSVVRFGNVLGSRGSVVPLFKRQIAHGGPVTVTHPDMKRYFMTIPEAVHLVLQAAAMGKNGEVFLLNMGQQVRILDLAEDLIRLSGLEPDKDIEIVFTGIRPGDKLSEVLWEEGREYQRTNHPEIFRLEEEEAVPNGSLRQTVDQLLRLADRGETDAILDLLDEFITGTSVRSAPTDITSVI